MNYFERAKYFRTKKRLGQNFLIADWVPRDIAEAAGLDEGCGVTPGEMLAKLNEAGIEGRYLWKPMHLQPVFADCPFVRVSEKTVCDDLFARGVCLPSDTKMSMDDVDRVCKVIRGMF